MVAVVAAVVRFTDFCNVVAAVAETVVAAVVVAMAVAAIEAVVAALAMALVSPLTLYRLSATVLIHPVLKLISIW